MVSNRAAHLDTELHLDPDDLANPIQAAAASAAPFILGALLPPVAILLPPPGIRVPMTLVAVLITLGPAGAISARIGGSDTRRAVLRSSSKVLGLAFNQSRTRETPRPG
jgi:VIT1/CCC1 family predicted Fe2+/Mn2+ transporter